MKISAIIPTFNEEEHISEAIKSVSWADEIIVVDSYSTIKPSKLLKVRVKIIQREYQYSASQKNWAIPKQNITGFFYSADERVSNSLKEIDNWKRQFQIISHTGYIELIILWEKNKIFRLAGDKVLRLFHRVADMRIKFMQKFKISSKVGKLKSPILHLLLEVCLITY